MSNSRRHLPPALKSREHVKARTDLVLVAEPSLENPECPPEEFHVHKVIMATVSPFFEMHFSYTAKKTGQPVTRLQLTGIHEDILLEIVEFAYSGVVKITIDNCVALRAAADYLSAEYIVQECDKFSEELERRKQDQEVHDATVEHLSSILNIPGQD